MILFAFHLVLSLLHHCHLISNSLSDGQKKITTFPSLLLFLMVVRSRDGLDFKRTEEKMSQLTILNLQIWFRIFCLCCVCFFADPFPTSTRHTKFIFILFSLSLVHRWVVLLPSYVSFFINFFTLRRSINVWLIKQMANPWLYLIVWQRKKYVSKKRSR